MPGRGETGHVQAGLGDDHLGGMPGDAGDLLQSGDGRQHRRIRALASTRSGAAVGIYSLSPPVGKTW